MANDTWKRRYAFRLTNDDKDIYDFINSSKTSESETIRKLLKIAINFVHQEREKKDSVDEYKKIKNELEEIKIQQNKAFQDILSKLEQGIAVNSENDAEEMRKHHENENVNKSVENSIDSILESFG